MVVKEATIVLVPTLARAHLPTMTHTFPVHNGNADKRRKKTCSQKNMGEGDGG